MMLECDQCKAKIPDHKEEFKITGTFHDHGRTRWESVSKCPECGALESLDVYREIEG
jgi:hypothetical protein